MCIELTGVPNTRKRFASDCSDGVQAPTLDIVSFLKKAKLHDFSGSYSVNAFDCSDKFLIGVNSFRRIMV